MKNLILLATVLLSAQGVKAQSESSYADYPIQGVPFSQVTLDDAFWASRITQNRDVTIPIALKQCETTGRIANFDKAAAILRGENIGYFDTEYTFDDTDIYKILEGMSYSYKSRPDAALKAEMDELIAKVGAAQEADGYLMTARTAGKPGSLHSWLGAERWTLDPNLSHEHYNSGHLYEAAAAHYEATGDTSLLRIATRNADLLVSKFLYGGLTYEPGHQIIEMGLVKLYRITGCEDYLKLAKYFLDIRGKYTSSTKSEYCQSHQPVTDQQEAVGHAVRAAYMYSGMADVAAIMSEQEYLDAIDRIWENVVYKKYYITGGIGARHSGEAFGFNFELPNETAYNETCAAIANVYWNWRMFLLHGDAKYYDVIERTLYNGVLSGINLSGDHFFYPNPLQSSGGYSRSEWFGCACCPSNLCRFIASVPGYIYAHKEDRVYVNLFVSGKAVVPLTETDTLCLTQQTDMPWEGNVAVRIDRAPESLVKLYVRLPGWAVGNPVPGDLYSYIDHPSAAIELCVNGEKTDYATESGYAVIERQWKSGDEVTFTLPMDVHRVTASDAVTEDVNKVAVERGPIVYCLEWPDNEGRVLNSVVEDDAVITVVNDSSTFSTTGTVIKTLKIEGACAAYGEDDCIHTKEKQLTAIPYYTWANRGAGEMAVWIAREGSAAEVTRDAVANTDTLHICIGQVPTTVMTTVYPSVAVPLDRLQIERTMGIGEQRLSSYFGSEVTFAALEPSGNINEKQTAIAPGQWFNCEGYVVSWCDPAATTNVTDQSIVFSELDTQVPLLNVGQFPKLCSEGDKYSFCQTLTRVPTDGSAPSRVVLHVDYHVTTAEQAWEYAKAYGQAFIDNPDYSYVEGDVRTTLESLVTEELSSATESVLTARASGIYTAITAFVSVRKDNDVTASYLTNPSFENGVDGWSITLSGSGSQNIISEALHAAPDGTYYCGFWRSTLNQADFRQKVTLPAGTYTMSADAEYSCNSDPLCRWNTICLYFGSHKSEAMPFDATLTGASLWQTFSYTFTLDAQTTAQFGAQLLPVSGGTWGHIDNFRLVRHKEEQSVDFPTLDKLQQEPHAIYNLSGQRLPEVKKSGIYIIDGRLTFCR